MTRRSFLSSGLAAGAIVRPESGAPYARRIFERINELRVARGSAPLIWSEALTRCAVEQSVRKMELRFAGHNDPERGDVAQRLHTAGIDWMRCGENIFSERGWPDPVNFAVVFWWYSPGHQENLLNNEYTHTGIGVAQAADETWYVTQIFTQPRPAGHRTAMVH